MPEDFREITLRLSVYKELLTRLDRFVERQDNGADRNWLREFISNVREAEENEV